MKTTFTVLTFMLAVCSFNLFAQTQPTVREQLEALNAQWKTIDHFDPILSKEIQLSNDVDLITTHLTLVEKYLRAKPLTLTESQRRNRNLCLDILKEYRERGVYPLNTYHRERTPYFIDKYGTACAVGQLIISTGHESFAKNVSAENNYAYIEDMLYPELFAWADEHGFTVDELKWIQPCYSFNCVNAECPDNTQRNVSCYGGNDGCVGASPATSLPAPPYVYEWFRFDVPTSSWTNECGMCPCLPCDLGMGTYKWKVMNSLGDVQEIIYNIAQPDSLSIMSNATNDDGSCNGSIVASFGGGFPPYQITWTHNGDTVTNLSGLCHGVYTVLLTDSNNCSKSFDVTVDLSSAVPAIRSSNAVDVFPNPANDRLTVSARAPRDNKLPVAVYNIMGQLVLEAALSQTNQLDISSLQNGVYVLRIDNVFVRFVKQNAH